MITVYQYPRLLGIPNMSPFCLKLEAWLRMVDIKYDIREVADPRKGPKGKLPFIKDDEIVVADTSMIIDYLKKKHSIQIDDHLTLSERAVALAFERMLDEHLYWALLYNRWVDDNWVKTKEALFSTLPVVLKGIVPAVAQKNIKSELDGHGMGRHSRDEVYERANQDLKALTDFLADKPYLMGDQPSTVDATLYAYLCNILEVPLRSPMKDYLNKCKNIRAYNERMGAQLFPEFFRQDESEEAWLTER
ncbi:glutathione S-transferase family protein [Alkalimarinus alittae]|uniref:Glutathione S-transferase family protein n=1 Tax=Alkalimarinus alittae TaxID=2961619 RepID=A0ABY6N1Q9_9ALTE|nr:glutathione S-transferase family protein [Alkalimarinus alittae]UZE95955.1 glutathione S-transferase family protein [Alkalimarinus alittae]